MVIKDVTVRMSHAHFNAIVSAHPTTPLASDPRFRKWWTLIDIVRFWS